MNRGDMEGLLSHYHPNCGDGERDGRIDSIVVIAVAEQSGDPLLLLYCTKKRLAIIVDPEWPFLPPSFPRWRRATPRNAASISLPIPSSLLPSL